MEHIGPPCGAAKCARLAFRILLFVPSKVLHLRTEPLGSWFAPQRSQCRKGSADVPQVVDAGGYRLPCQCWRTVIVGGRDRAFVLGRLVGVEEAAEGSRGAGMGNSYQAMAITDGRVPPPVAFELEDADSAN